MARRDRGNLEQLLQDNPTLQAQLEERIAAAVAQARAQWEGEALPQQPEEQESGEPGPDLAETTPEGELNSAEAAQQALAAERQALEEEKAAFARQRMEVAVGQELQKRGLPTTFAAWLAGETAEDSAQRVDTFEVLFREAVAAAVTERMRGRGAPREPQKPRGYSREELRNMTHQEINANWDAIQRALEA